MANYTVRPIKPQFVYDSEMNSLHKQIKQIEKDFRVQEIDIVFKQERFFYNTIRKSDESYSFIKEIIGEGIEVQEHFVVLYLNQSNKVIGYYKHTKGTINSTQVDVEMITAVALKILAKSVILAHNHPSGNENPSEADKAITSKIKAGLKMFDIQLLDHIILTRSGYFSFADNGESSLSGIQVADEQALEQKLREEILQQLRKVTKVNSPHIWARIQTKVGYLKIEGMIIQRMLSQQIVPSAIIPQMEMAFDEV